MGTLGRRVTADKNPSAYLLILLIILNPLPAHALSFFQYSILLSFSHSLASRVANLRDSRGDKEGAARARAIAEKLYSLNGLGFWKSSWSRGWDYLTNYASSSSSIDRDDKNGFSLREDVETLLKEFVEGDFYWDCLKLGTSDLKGLMHVIKEITTLSLDWKEADGDKTAHKDTTGALVRKETYTYGKKRGHNDKEGKVKSRSPHQRKFESNK